MKQTSAPFYSKTLREIVWVFLAKLLRAATGKRFTNTSLYVFCVLIQKHTRHLSDASLAKSVVNGIRRKTYGIPPLVVNIFSGVSLEKYGASYLTINHWTFADTHLIFSTFFVNVIWPVILLEHIRVAIIIK